MKPLLYLGCPEPDRLTVGLEMRAAGFAVRWVEDVDHAIGEIEENACPILVDLRSTAALVVGASVRKQRPGAAVFGVADPARPAMADRARRAGFVDVLVRPIAAKGLAPCFAPEQGRLHLADGNGADGLPGVVACSSRMRAAVSAAKIAGSMPAAGILICGDDGTGRRFLARAIHSVYSKPGGKIVEADCSPSPGVDHELTLFGTAGASALSDAGERITAASLLYHAFGGTLLLLNLAEMPARLQARLARVLRDCEVIVQGEGRLAAPVRPIACVGHDFDAKVREGQVRADLLKRIATTRIEMPPLRDRREDMAELIDEFLRTVCQLLQVPQKRVSYPALTLLSSLPFRGHARELRALLRTLAERSAGNVIRLDDVLKHLRLDVASESGVPPVCTLRDARARFEQQYIREVLARHHGRMGDAARSLGIERTNLYRKMRTLGLARRSAGPSDAARGGVR